MYGGPNGHKKAIVVIGKVRRVAVFCPQRTLYEIASAGPACFFWLGFVLSKIPQGPFWPRSDPTKHDTPRSRGSSAGARRHATTAPWGMVHRRRRRHRQTALLPCSRTAGHLVRPLSTTVQQERKGRTSEHNPDRPNEQTSRLAEEPYRTCRIKSHLHSDDQRQEVVARTLRR